MNRLSICFAAAVTLATAVLLAEPPTTAPANAATLYIQAAQSITVDCPAASNLTYPDYPPFGADWDKLAREAWEKNTTARQLAHQASSIDHADWPDPKQMYLSPIRALANDLGDASLYQHLHGEDAAAAQTIHDLLHLSAMLDKDPRKTQLVQILVAGGIDALTSARCMIIASDVALTTDPKNAHDLQIPTAKQLIAALLDQPDTNTLIAQLAAADKDWLQKNVTDMTRAKETFARCYAERAFAAMSLACHVYRFENKRWPQSLADLVPAYLSSIPIDPWGDGKQTLGYALIKAGLPDGADRPLLYSRCMSPDGLFYRTDQPQYSFCVSDGSKLPSAQEMHGGQFRDVARWIPEPEAAGGPTTKALP